MADVQGLALARVEPLALERLPRVSGALLATPPWAWAGARDRVLGCELAGVGTLRLSWVGASGADPSLQPSVERFRLVDRDGRTGSVAIDRWLSLAIVAATLGMPAPIALRRLGPGERGVLGGHLVALLARWGRTIAQSIAIDLGDSGRVEGDAPPTAVVVRAEAAGAAGTVSIQAPAAWLALGKAVPARSNWLPETELRAAAERLATVASVELASTTLRFAELAGARAGDAVVFDGAAWPGEGDRLVALRLGDRAAPARLSADGRLALAGRFEAVVKGTGPMTDDRDEAARDSAEVLAAAPIEIVAELGRIVLRGDEVLALGEGSVLAFGRPGTTVDLVVGGRTWAHGELVNVDGELGVRITELARRARP
jgi:type III secretion system YscQ/HrcQ family protein